MKSDSIMEKIIEDISEPTPAGNESSILKEEVKNLEERLKNEISKKLGEVEKSLSEQISKSPGRDSEPEKGGTPEDSEALGGGEGAPETE